jgi:peptidoglycan/LPS O-acetylase OafA/YrhL
MRRGLKIWPSYFVAYGMMVVFISGTALWNGSLADALSYVKRSIPNVIFIQNYLPAYYRWPHSWSIAVEEHFYLGLPILLLFMLKRNDSPQGAFRWLPAVGVGICLAVLLGRIWRSAHIVDYRPLYYPTHARMDSLFCGVVLGYFHAYHRDRFVAAARTYPVFLFMLPFALALTVVLPKNASMITPTIGFTIYYLVFGGLVMGAAARPSMGEGNRLARLVALTGVYSYTIYLAHAVVPHIPGIGRPGFFPGGVWVDRLVFVSLSVALGVGLSYAVEQPFLRWRSKLYPSPREAVATDSPRTERQAVPA